METILSFFSNLIIFTFGLVVLGIWIVIVVGLAVEVYDMITGDNDDDSDDRSLLS